MNLRNVVAFCGFFLLLGYEPANSTSDSIMLDDNGYCGYSEAEEDLCASYCFKSVKPYLAYVIELKEQIKEKDNELRELRKNDSRDQIAKIKEFITQTINNQKADIKDFVPKVAKGEISKDSCKCLPSGIHLITISGLDPFHALCNGNIAFSGGWMVIHRRFDGSENFQRNWTDFRNGFGSLDKEFFIGLELLHRITNSETYELYIQIEHFNGTLQFASYDNFRIGNEESKYELESLGEFKGTAVNQMKFNVNQKFSTMEQDNDNIKDFDCASYSQGAWWYNGCEGPNFNGKYYDHEVATSITISWIPYNSLKSAQMLIRPKLNHIQNF